MALLLKDKRRMSLTPAVAAVLCIPEAHGASLGDRIVSDYSYDAAVPGYISGCGIEAPLFQI